MVEYFAVTPPNGQPVYFAINQTSGEITTTAVLDRESFGSRYLFFTVRAVDKGQPPGDDYCTFPISITDVNDNNPAFGQSNFQGSILRTAAVGSLVMTVKATDKDIGANAEVTYAKVQDTPYFNINPGSGAIAVVQTLNSAVSYKCISYSYACKILSNDRKKKGEGGSLRLECFYCKNIIDQCHNFD